jgi:hypothetical protein
MPQEQEGILEILAFSSCTPNKQVMYWDGVMVINNHQIGNMMPFPSGTPSINSIRADVLRDPGMGFNEHDRMLCRNALSSETKQGADVKHYDYFDRFLSEVEKYYASRNDYSPESALQVAINYQRGYFDFFQTYVNYIESNLLQDFAGKDLWAITDFSSYVQIANQIIDRRGARFTA